ncbi:MAG: dethiobiotin synthetase [Myxococcota bacterium]|jgi:dethiobiotin synthetase
MSGFFITGTDTGVGKTVVSCAIVAGLRKRGLDVGVMKPMETGVGDAGPLDAIALREAAGVEDTLEEICPIQFALPAAPNVAAHAEGRVVDLNVVTSGYKTLASRHEIMVVEGAGGLLVPTVESEDMGSLSAALGLPIIVVARMALGTINHTLLTLREIERRGLPLAGVVLSESGGVLSEADRANLAHLRSELGERLIGEVPHLPEGVSASSDAIQMTRLLAD